MKPIRIFISYSHKDEEFRKELSSHLRLPERLGLITAWHDRRIPAGAKWKAQIDTHVEEADVILCLVSAYFFESDYCYEKEMKRALERHERGETIVIPIIVRSVAWHDSPLAALQALPPDAKAVEDWDHPAQAWTAVVQGLMEAAEGIFGVQEKTRTRMLENLSRVNPSVGAILDGSGILRNDHGSFDEARFSPDLTLIQLREPRLADLIASHRKARASEEWFRRQTDALTSKIHKMNGTLAIIAITAFAAEAHRRSLQKLIAEAEAVVALEDSAVQAGPGTRQLLDPSSYGLRSDLGEISNLVNLTMTQYSKSIRAVENQVEILEDAYRKAFQKTLGKDAWEDLYGEDS